CLAKNRKDRWHAIADVRVELERILADPYGRKSRAGVVAEQKPLWRRAIPVAAALIAALALVIAVITLSNRTRPGPPEARRPVRFVSSAAVSPVGLGLIAISLDGAHIAFAGLSARFMFVGSMNLKPGRLWVPKTRCHYPSLQMVNGSATSADIRQRQL